MGGIRDTHGGPCSPSRSVCKAGDSGVTPFSLSSPVTAVNFPWEALCCSLALVSPKAVLQPGGVTALGLNVVF